MRLLCLVSMLYDALLGAATLLAQGPVERWIGLAPLNYPVHGQLNGLFALSVAAGYWIPLRGLAGARLYLWIFGVGLKAAGALLFLLRVAALGDPPIFLTFTVTDGLLALWSLWVVSRADPKSAP